MIAARAAEEAGGDGGGWDGDGDGDGGGGGMEGVEGLPTVGEAGEPPVWAKQLTDSIELLSVRVGALMTEVTNLKARAGAPPPLPRAHT